MKGFVVVCLFALSAVALARPNEDKYTDKYDNVNLKEILSNKRLLVPYVHCILDMAKCAPDAKELKGHIADALETGCSKCNEVQKAKVEETIAHLINEEPVFWSQLTDKYDPKKKYSQKYESDLRRIKA